MYRNACDLFDVLRAIFAVTGSTESVARVETASGSVYTIRMGSSSTHMLREGGNYNGLSDGQRDNVFAARIEPIPGDHQGRMRLSVDIGHPDGRIKTSPVKRVEVVN